MAFSRNILIVLDLASVRILGHTYSDNDRPGVNCGAVADTDARKQEAVRADPHIPTDVYLRGRRGALWSTTPDESVICRRLDSVDRHVGTYGCVVANRDVA